MADTAYSNWCARAWTPSGASATRQYRARLDTQLNVYDTYCTMSCWLYLELTRTVSHSGYHWGASNGGTGTGSSVFEDSKIYLFYSWTTGAVTRGHSAGSISASGYIYASSSGGSNKWNNEVVTAARTYSVPARASYAVTYDANNGTGSQTDTKWFAENLTLSSGAGFTREGYELLKWNTEADGSGTDYALGSTYTANAALTLYAIWQKSPTCTVTVTSSAPYYTGKASYAVNISNVSVSTEFDPNATVESIVLELGTQSTSSTTGGALSITPSIAGTYTPVLQITDTLGASRTYTLPSVTVKQYVSPAVLFTVERTTATGVTDEVDGMSCVITASFSFCDDAYNLVAPIVSYESGSTATVTWHTTRASNGVVSNPVVWNNITSGQIIYGLITGAFLTTQSYIVSVTPRDNRASGSAKTQTLAMAAYPIDFYAGGGGVAFGRTANADGMFVDMDAMFEKGVGLYLDDNDGSGDDYRLLSAFARRGWTIHSDNE